MTYHWPVTKGHHCHRFATLTTLISGVFNSHMVAKACDRGVNMSDKPNLKTLFKCANLANAKWCKTPKKILKPWHIGTHLIVLRGSYPMNSNMSWFRWFSKVFVLLCFGLSIASTLEGLIISLLNTYRLYYWVMYWLTIISSLLTAVCYCFSE